MDIDLILDWGLGLLLFFWPVIAFIYLRKVETIRWLIGWLVLNVVLFIMTSGTVSIYLQYPEKNVPMWLTHSYQWIGTLGGYDEAGVLFSIEYHIVFFVFAFLLLSKIVMKVRRNLSKS